jgi:hypothetical protein
VTYTLICCTAAMEFSLFDLAFSVEDEWSNKVPQYNLITFFTRDKNATSLLKVACFHQCKDYVNQHWYA